MRDPFIIFLTDIFFSLQAKGLDGYLLVKLTVPCKMLLLLYNRFEMGEIKPIEILEPEEKTKYWEIGKKYHPDQDSAIKAAKAAYVLTLLTSQPTN